MNNVLMKEKVYEDSSKDAKTPLMIYYAKIDDNTLCINLWQNERQWSVNDVWSGMIGNLLRDRLRAYINE